MLVEFGWMVSEYEGVMGEMSCEMVVPRSLMVDAAVE